MHLEKNKHAFSLLTVTLKDKMNKGRPFIMVRDVIIDRLVIVIPDIDKRDRKDNWIECARDRSK